ncbi:MAG: zinc-ribbon domain-containing protein [Gemmatimonadales bacterium]|nr:zinc-ribbon domain-containing protein [Gemmatimonadales bacterium]
MNATCTSCQTVFRVDPAKVPAAGVRARCSVCSGIFWVRVTAPVAVPAAIEVPAPPPEPVRPEPARDDAPGSPFGDSFDDWHARTTAPTAADAIEERRTREPDIPTPWPEFPPEPAAPEVPQPVGVDPVPHAVERPSTPAFGPGPALAPPAVGGLTSPARPVEKAAAMVDAALPPVTPPVTAPRSPTPPAVSSGGFGPAFAPPQAAAVPAPALPGLPRPAAPAPPVGAAVRKARVNPFMRQDPAAKARRLARALISDMVVYHPAKRREGLQRNSLKALFEEEIKKSWEEYVDQVGAELAESTPFFHEALNEILADGQTLFP